jgi:23S rRNA (uracil1939-C5)-methyltransferase
MNKGERVTLDISSMNSEGEGVARVGDEKFVVFVEGALPGEKVLCRVARSGKTYAAARIVDILSASPFRVQPRCPSYGKCGGCGLQHTSYEAQLDIKQTILADALERIGKVRLPRPISCVPSPKRWGYRNKTSLPVQRGAGGAALVCGYYERRSHNAVPFGRCEVLEHPLEQIVRSAINDLGGANFKGYDEKEKTGDIRHLAVRSGDGETLLGVVSPREISSREFGSLRNISQRLMGKNSSLVGAALNVKKSPDNFIWGPEFKPLCGKNLLTQKLGSYRFDIDISSFFQINSEQAAAIFERAADLIKAKLPPDSRVLELYSGAGGLTAYLAGRAGSVDAVEERRIAARRIEDNMALNGISNVRVHASSAEDFMPGGSAVPGGYDAVVVDPPRSGCDEKVIDGIKRLSPEIVIYVSCNPATLARDVFRLTSDDGVKYALEDVTAFDMFPQTAHVESVSLLTRM